jgi:TetR/AcrR family transcriptional regulator, regulator of cefoperazone and chloramphenicol sensitivity
MNAKTQLSVLATGADATRQSLLLAGLQHFGDKGFDATSTRELAATANANIGSIAYHFGGKTGLYRACGDFIIDRLQPLIGASLAALDDPRHMPPTAARQLILMLVQRFASFLLCDRDANLIAPFMLREMAHPGEVFEKVYTTVMEPAHKRLCMVWEAATGETAENAHTILTLFSMIGQVMYFRFAAVAVKKRLGWREIGPAEAASIVGAITQIVEVRLTNNRSAVL